VLDDLLLSKLAAVEQRFEEVSGKLSDPAIMANRQAFQKMSKEHSDLRELVDCIRIRRDLTQRIDDARDMQKDPEMRDLAYEEERTIGAERNELEERIKVLLLPRDPNDDKNIMLEVRAGAGGEEAALFAAELFRMYTRFAERRRWVIEIVSGSAAQAGGMKEVVAMIKGNGVYSQLKYESGVHRVQRVPATEAQGRIHTSTATVAVMPEVEDVEVVIDSKDLKIDVMRSGGPGGQSVNTTDSAVRIHHIPSGLIVHCQQEKSQHKNKAMAMALLRSRLFAIEEEKSQSAERDERRGQIGTGDRSEKIRTYNFPQDRLTDHRIGMTKHNLPGLMDGDLQDVVDSLRAHFQAEALKQAGSAP
jgi:peptide chain release factor 1